MAWLAIVAFAITIVGIVEHDAYMPTLLHTIEDLRTDGADRWPLYAALNICLREVMYRCRSLPCTSTS